MTNWFQTDECLKFYGDLSFVEPFECAVTRDGIVKGRIVGYVQKDGGLIKSFLSRRAVINGGPMLADDITEDELAELLRRCGKALKGRAIYVETRNFDDYSGFRPVFEACGWTCEPHYNFHIDTSSMETVEANLGKSRKRDIRTSLRDGASTGEAGSLEEVKELYSILRNLYSTKVKTPLFPFEFFEKLYSAPWGKVFVVRYGGRVVGGPVCACGADTVYEWFACGEDGMSRSVFPSTMATYAGIGYAAGNGFRRFDMMGAGAPGDGGYGVRDFKAKFGGELVEHGRFRLVLNRPLYCLGTLAVRIMKKF